MQEPLTPADCDLRGLPFMPLDVIRLLDSDLFAVTNGDEFKAAVALWCKSWTQIPSGSLPNDDRVLAHLSSAGPRWKKLKAGAMRGWILCSDNRWYHPVVAEKALEALPMRQQFEDKKSAEAARKQRERDDRKTLFELLRSHGAVPDWDTPTRQLRELAKPYQSQPVTPDVTPPVTDMSQPVTAKTGTGTEKGQGQGQVLKPSVPDGTGAAAPPKGLSAKEAVFQVAVPWLVGNGSKETSVRSLLGGAVKQLGEEGAWQLASECMREKPIEPLSWIAAALNARIAKLKNGGKGKDATLEDQQKASTEEARRLLFGNQGEVLDA